MHIPDGYLGPETVAAGWAACAPVWYVANKKTKEFLSQPKSAPVLAASAAFSFLVMMLNVPVAGGTTAHAVGAVLIAVIAGPWVAVLAVTAALVIQALLFGDGGILALGVNSLNMAIVMPFVGYAVYRLIAGGSGLQSARRLVAAGIGAYVGIVAAAALCGTELGIQPLLHSVNGVPQYAPYGLRTALAAMVGAHVIVVGPIEAAFTVGVVAFLRRTSPELFHTADLQRVRARWLGVIVGVLVALVPLGLIASGTAWGEWSGEELRGRLGYVPSGFSHLEGLWKGVLPDYSFAGASGTTAVLAYVLSAIVGVGLLGLVAWLLVRARRRRPERTHAGS
jgi:cobalt/nickel transport system permease protein